MSDSNVVSNFEITQIIDESANHDFFKFRFHINSGGKSVKIRFSANNNCTGILFVPCKHYDSVAASSQKTKAIGVCQEDGDLTQVKATIPTNFIRTHESETELIFENLPDGVFKAEICSIVVGLRDKHSLGVEYKLTDDSNWKDVDCKLIKERKNPVQERFEWITNFVDKYTLGQSVSNHNFPQFHPKQQATINALKMRSNFSKDSSGLVTYVGTDDTANFLTAISQIVKVSKSDIQCMFRHDSDHDKSTHTEFVGKWSSDLGVQLLDPSTHSQASSWVESDIILDTYTLMSWPDKSLAGSLSEIRTRINHLGKGGCLVLVFPTDVSLERFSTFDELPDLFKMDLVKIKTKVSEDNKQEHLEISSRTLGNTAWMLLSKSDRETNEHSSQISSPDPPYVNNPVLKQKHAGEWDINSQPDKYEPIIAPGKEPSKPPPVISDQIISELDQAQNWIDFQRAVQSKGQREPMLRPVELPIVEAIRTHLKEKILRQGYGKYVIIQAHPGWGKTSNLGEALFPADKSKVDFLEGYTIWVGTLEEVQSWVSNSRNFEKSIVIIDDIHKYRESISNYDLHNQAMNIASKVSALFVTCQIDPMDGEVYDVSPEVSESGISHIIDAGFFPNLDDDSENLFTNFVR